MSLTKFVVAVRTFVYFALLGLTSLPFALLFPLYRFRLVSDAVSDRAIVVYLHLVLLLLRLICGITWEVRGRENIPDTACLLASQHQSFWENMFFPYLLGNPAFFAKKEIFGYPFAGTLVRRNGHIMADRSGDLNAAREAFEKAIAISRSGRNVLIYPGGTRSGPGHDTIKSGIGLLYSRLGVPCVPIRLNTGTVWPAGSWLKYPGHIVITIRPALPAGMERETFMAKLARELDLKNPKPGTPREAAQPFGPARQLRA
ncbi:MAG: 1-acyl-sn-glycerol-3-phosphate acyltransferase [Phyllobacteriaceae bacterium]|nr:1-acyl-sn-glycerol-3-phosphate acyltransferase [Phyllobacteriaceae bacterium]